MSWSKSLYRLLVASPGPPHRVRVARGRTGRNRRRDGRAGVVGVHGDHGAVGPKRRVGDEEGELSVRGGHDLKSSVHFSGVRRQGARRAPFARRSAHGHAAGRRRGAGHLHHGLAEGRVRGPRGELVLVLAGVVHGVDLRHAAGQVSQEPCPDFGVDALAGGQEPGDLVHALAETGAVLPEDRRVCVERSCGETRSHMDD